jgi:hypothetical protein
VPKAFLKDHVAFRKELRRLGIRYPGDNMGEYAHGTEVYVEGINKVVRLVEKLAEPGHYKIAGGATYVESRTREGIVQRLDTGRGVVRIPMDEPVTIFMKLRGMISDYLVKHGESPTILHISFSDLEQMVREESRIADTGDLGLDIALVPRGESMSVDRRI